MSPRLRQNRAHYPHGYWLADEGPPPPLLLQGNAETCVLHEGGSALPPEFAAVDDAAVAAIAAAAATPSPTGEDAVAAQKQRTSEADEGADAYAGPSTESISLNVAAIGDGSLPHPWILTIDVDALPSGNADDFAGTLL